jgi:hypothetical protein
MPFANQVAAGKQLTRQVLQSAGFLPSVAGWMISRGGDAEFNNVIVRGQIIAVTTINTMPAMTSGWTVGAHAKYALDPLGNLVVAFKQLLPGTVTDGTPIWAPGSLDPGYRPPDSRRVGCYTDNLKINNVGGTDYTEGAALEIGADGSVLCFGISLASTRADLFAVIPLAF